MQKIPYDIVIFFVVVTAVIVIMVAFIISMLYLYRKKQQEFEKSLEQQKLDYEKSILSTQLEIQEQTFQHISREIHDNINLSLTLAKLNLNVIDWNDKEEAITKTDSSIELLTNSISELSDISKSLNANIIIQQGLIHALKAEIQRIQKASPFSIDIEIKGNPVFFDSQKDLVIFRIIQEAFNNIIKHAGAKKVKLSLDYDSTKLLITISDNGLGFSKVVNEYKDHAGLKNMETRVVILNGSMHIDSHQGVGTTLSFTIPLNE